ncbi:MAG: GAF domain-containing protein, partial [Bacteroidota bacterium]
MKFFRNRSLLLMASLIVGAMFLIYVSEYLIIRNKIETLEEIEEKKDYARSSQLGGQQIALLVQQFLHDGDNVSAEISSRIEEQEYHLNILGRGGRMEGTNIFLKPLTRLPAISFEKLYEHWTKYKDNTLFILTERVASTGPMMVESDTSSSDSMTVMSTDIPALSPFDKAKVLLPGQWLTVSNWYEKLLADLGEEAEAKKSSVENWFFFFILLDVVLLGVILYLFHRYVLRPLKMLETNAHNLQQDHQFPPHEIGQLAEQVNQILEQLRNATEFVGAIGEGNLNIDYTTLEEERRKWANEGLTKFVDILRSSNDNINTLGDKIISALVQYTHSNQGGLYILNDEDEHNKHLELISLFAFDIKKFSRQKIRLGEGILGQTFLEKETTLLKEVPDEYIRITSGLGDAAPKALLIVPLKVDTEVYGIVELASFKDFQQHEIEFVERLAETIASTLASVKAAQKNRHLIEQFQQQTEEMRAQEEEMRQNMEELQATQEEMARKERDYISRIQELEQQQSEGAALSEQLTSLKEEYGRKERDHKAQLR